MWMKSNAARISSSLARLDCLPTLRSLSIIVWRNLSMDRIKADLATTPGICRFIAGIRGSVCGNCRRLPS